MRITNYLGAVIAAAALVCMSACTPATTAPPGSPSSIVSVPPLAGTAVDDKALAVAFHTFDAVLTAVDALVDAKVIVPGSSTALKLSSALQTTRDALNAASAAQRVAGAANYPAALMKAQAAVDLVAALVKGIRR